MSKIVSLPPSVVEIPFNDNSPTGRALWLRMQVKGIVAANVHQALADIAGDDVINAEVVAAGEFHFRKVFREGMGFAFVGNLAECDALADAVYRFAREQWRWKRKHKPDISGLEAKAYLDALEQHSGPTQREIDESWEVDIHSSESAMRDHWEGSARHRKGRLEELGSKDVVEVKKGQETRR